MTTVRDSKCNSKPSAEPTESAERSTATKSVKRDGRGLRTNVRAGDWEAPLC